MAYTIPGTDISIDLGDAVGAAGEVGAALLPYTLTADQISKLEQMGTTLKTEAGTIGTEAAGAAAFKPVTIASSTGGSLGFTPTMGADGEATGAYGLDYTLGADEQAIMSGLLGQAKTAATGYTPTSASDLYAMIQGMRDPETTRARQEMEARLAAQGRLGTRTSMFGGTPEALAMEKAIQEQQSKDILSALTTAPELDKANLANIAGMLGVAYAPQQELKGLFDPAIQMSNILQSAGIAESEAMYKSGMAGLEAGAAATTAASGLEAARTRALGDALSGFFQSQGGDDSSYQQLLSALGLGSSSPGDSSSLSDQDFFDLYGYFRDEMA